MGQFYLPNVSFMFSVKNILEFFNIELPSRAYMAMQIDLGSQLMFSGVALVIDL